MPQLKLGSFPSRLALGTAFEEINNALRNHATFLSLQSFPSHLWTWICLCVSFM
jgi:hypothetical protein